MTTTDESRFHAAVARAKQEILDDIADGRIPADVGRFSRLHDFVDANEYGGACDYDFPDDWEPSEEWMDFWNAVQDEVDVWLRCGRITPGCTTSD